MPQNLSRKLIDSHLAYGQTEPGEVLKEFLHRDYRGVEELLRDTPELAAVIELKQVPDFTTLQKAAKRLLRAGLASHLL
jgi:hypothetical protein